MLRQSAGARASLYAGGMEDRTPPEHLLRTLDAGARLLRAWPLTGGVSARVTALEVQWSGGQTGRLVVRQYGERDVAANPRVAGDEFRLLHLLKAAGLPVPAPRHVEGVGDLLPTPALVTDFVDGATEFDPTDVPGFVRQLAGFLAQLHGLPGAADTFSFLRPLAATGPRPAVLDETLSESRIRAALDALGTPPPTASAVLHGDFWPGNVLWRSGRLAAVIDWEDAARGDALADVGNARLELLFFLGAEAMRGFTRHYQGLTGVDLASLPYWDLRAALRPCGRLSGWGLDSEVESRLRERHRLLVDGALELLNAP